MFLCCYINWLSKKFLIIVVKIGAAERISLALFIFVWKNVVCLFLFDIVWLE